MKVGILKADLNISEYMQIARETLPTIREWIDALLTQHARAAKPVMSFGFTVLPEFFAADFIDRIRVVLVPSVPLPPLAQLGLEQLRDFSEMQATAITFRDTYFIHPQASQDESVHFHELVHALQWLELGFDGFLLAYGYGLLTSGYADNPLEVQARRHERKFRAGAKPYDVHAAVGEELTNIRDVLAGTLGDET